MYKPTIRLSINLIAVSIFFATTTMAVELGMPSDVDRLDNGNTLTVDLLHASVIEVNPDKEIVWEYPRQDSFTLELDAFYETSTLSLIFTIGTPEPTTWANYLILTYPSIQVIPLWTVPLPQIDPPIDVPIAFPLTSLGWIGIYSSLFTAEGEQAMKLVWVDTDIVEERRVPAEWEPHEATWMQWPKGVESYYRENFSRIIDALQEYEPVNIIVKDQSARTQARNYLIYQGISLTNITWHIMPYDSAWLRDNGPVWVDVGGEPTVQDWGFDGWGEQYPPWEDDDAVPCRVAAIEGVPCESYGLINERGTLEFNGAGTLITSWTCLSDRNPGVSHVEMEELFEGAFGVTQVVWLLSAPSGDLTGGHVDGIARFIDEDTVAVVRYVNQNDPDAWVYEEAASIIQNAGFDVVRIDMPGYVMYYGSPLPAIYVNWLVANGVVVTTGFGVPEWDNTAKATIEGFFPDHDVFVVETLDVWAAGGGVHCVTNDQAPLYINDGP